MAQHNHVNFLSAEDQKIALDLMDMVELGTLGAGHTAVEPNPAPRRDDMDRSVLRSSVHGGSDGSSGGGEETADGDEAALRVVADNSIHTPKSEASEPGSEDAISDPSSQSRTNSGRTRGSERQEFDDFDPSDGRASFSSNSQDATANNANGERRDESNRDGNEPRSPSDPDASSSENEVIQQAAETPVPLNTPSEIVSDRLGPNQLRQGQELRGDQLSGDADNNGLSGAKVPIAFQVVPAMVAFPVVPATTMLRVAPATM